MLHRNDADVTIGDGTKEGELVNLVIQNGTVLKERLVCSLKRSLPATIILPAGHFAN
jgi:hypothetical protein